MNIRTHLLQSALTRWICLAIVLPSLVLVNGGAIAQDNGTHALLDQAKAYEQASDYTNAAAIYREYLLLPEPQSATRRHARLKLPVLQEAAKYGAGPEMQVYLNAMDARAAGNPQQADDLLSELIESYAGSALTDDAWYLRAYIALMDNYDYQAAIERLEYLRYTFPDSRYVDTSLFAEAIAHEQMGNSDSALANMTELRDRHTGLSFAGLDLAKDEYLSRLWFERSSSRIEYLKERAEIATHILSITSYGRDGFLWQVELLVDQQHITLLLNESDALTNVVYKNNTQTQIDSTVNAYAGIVAGEPDSWARITIENQNVRGMISVNGVKHELLPVTTGGSLSDFHTLLLGDIDGNESESPDHALIPPASEDKLHEFLRTIKQVETQTTEGEVNQVAMIGVVIDSKYNDYYSGRGAEEALSILNTTDGLFREQLGTALMVDTVVVIDNSSNDPMNLGSVTMETMMRNFRDYRTASADLGSDIGMATLFSGNKNSDSALGLAWIGSACRTDGYDVSVVTPYKFPALLSTHEIGHTMGAPHDSDTSCASQNQHIMWPFLSSTSGRSFSSCSKSAVAEVMAANYCHVDAMDIAVNLNSVDAKSLSIAVSNENTQRAIPDALVTISGTGIGTATAPDSCSANSNDTLQCYLGTITPLNSNDISLTFRSSLSDSSQISVSVAGVGYIDVNTHNNGFQTDMHGNVSAYSGSSSNNAITLSDTGNTSTTSTSTENKSIASAEGGGIVTPLSTIILALLIAFRRTLKLTSA